MRALFFSDHLRYVGRFLLAVLALAIGSAASPRESAVAVAAQEDPNRPPWAQKPNTSSAATGKSSPSKSDDADETPQRGRIRVNVNLVNVLVSVLDEHNRPVIDLPREAFQLSEEGVQQKIEVFETETQLPLDLVLMVDSSLSAHKEILFEEEAAAHFIRQVLRSGD